MQEWVLKVMVKFHNYPTVKEFQIVVLLGYVRVCEKKRGFWRDEVGKTNLRGKESAETHRKCKN